MPLHIFMNTAHISIRVEYISLQHEPMEIIIIHTNNQTIRNVNSLQCLLSFLAQRV